MRYYEIEREIQRSTISAWVIVLILILMSGLLLLIQPSEQLVKFELRKSNYYQVALAMDGNPDSYMIGLKELIE